MNDTILLVLADKWENDADTPMHEDGAPEAQIGSAIAHGRRECKRECADTIRTLVSMLGELKP